MFRQLFASVLSIFFLLSGNNPLCAQTSVLAQRVEDLKLSNVWFAPVSDLFTPLPGYKNPVSELERQSQFLQLNTEALSTLVSQRYEAITLSIPYQGQTLILDLYQAQVMAEGYVIQTNQGVESYLPGVYYRGIIRNVPNSLVAISFFDHEVIGVIAHPDWGNLNLGVHQLSGLTNRYVLYSDLLLPERPNGGCNMIETGEDTPHPQQTPEVSGCVQIMMEADYALYQDKGTIANTANYVSGYFNVVATLFNNETITIEISQIFIWITADPYDYSNSSSSLTDFQAMRNTTGFSGDLAQLASKAGGDNGLGGVAFLDVLCSNISNYSFAGIHTSYNGYPTYSWTVMVSTHELGHNFGSRHTHACVWNGNNTAIDGCGPTYGAGQGITYEGSCSGAPIPPGGGTMMSYCHLGAVGINFSLGFGPQPGNVIRSETTAALGASCITTNCPTSSCATPSNVSVSAIAATSAVVSWSGSGTTYTLQYRISGTSSWTTVSGIVSTTYTINSLSPATIYDVQVQAICSGTPSRYSTIIAFKTLNSPCAEPSAQTATPQSSTQVSLNWTENGTATTWEIQWGAAGFSLGSGTVAAVTSRPHVLSGLTQGQTYDYYVRSTCGGGLGNSAWVGPLTFTMPFSNNSSSSAIALTVGAPCPGLTNSSQFYNNVGATVDPGEFSPSTSNGGYWNTAANNTVWFSFVAPSSGAIYITTDLSPLGTLLDPQVALYDRANPTSINHHLVSNEDGGVLGPGYATYVYYCGLTPGSTYYIQVDGWQNDVGTFCIEVHETFDLPEPATCTSYTQASVNGGSAPNKWYNVYTKPNVVDIGLPVGAVKSSQNLGTVTIQTLKSATLPTANNGVRYMQRYYNFTCTLNANSPKQVRLFFQLDEFDLLRNAVNPSATINNLNVYHYDGTNEDCTPNNNASTGGQVLSAPGTTITATTIGSSNYFYLELQAPSFSEMTALLGNTPLPVELLDFSGEAAVQGNLLYWAVADENSLSEYVLQRSANGIDRWENLQTIPAKGASGTQQYETTDPQPLSEAWYRLQMTDLDGTQSYSPVVRIQRALKDGIQRITPNPAFQMIFVEFNAASEQTIQFSIVGADGRMVLQQSIDLVRGQNVLPFDVSALPAGLYYCVSNVGKGMMFEKTGY